MAPSQQPETLAPAFERALRTRQADRLPSVSGAVVRKGVTIWSGAVGLADAEAGREATPDTQYRIGSITKTFTAVAVMQLRDAGLLDLDDRLEQHIPDVAHGSPTLRRMLAHIAGFQRETGEAWVTGEQMSIEQILESLSSWELVLPPHTAHHYSNLAYGLLGEVVTRRSGKPFTEYVDETIVGPLGLTRTTWYPAEPFAQGYLVEEWAGTVSREPHTDLRGVSSMGQLWSTVEDLCKWATHLASLDEIWTPQVIVNPDRWDMGWGLGIALANRDGRIFGGHGGAMPGHLAGLAINRKTGVGAAALTNSGTRGPMTDLAIELAQKTIEDWPDDVETWSPESEPPPEVRAILGRWWSEGHEFVFTWEKGKLRGQLAGAPAWIEAALFEQIGENEYRSMSGRERGERLRVEGDRMVWAGYLFTRTQESTLG